MREEFIFWTCAVAVALWICVGLLLLHDVLKERERALKTQVRDNVLAEAVRSARRLAGHNDQLEQTLRKLRAELEKSKKRPEGGRNQYGEVAP